MSMRRRTNDRFDDMGLLDFEATLFVNPESPNATGARHIEEILRESYDKTLSSGVERGFRELEVREVGPHEMSISGELVLAKSMGENIDRLEDKMRVTLSIPIDGKSRHSKTYFIDEIVVERMKVIGVGPDFLMKRGTGRGRCARCGGRQRTAATDLQDIRQLGRLNVCPSGDGENIYTEDSIMLGWHRKEIDPNEDFDEMELERISEDTLDRLSRIEVDVPAGPLSSPDTPAKDNPAKVVASYDVSGLKYFLRHDEDYRVEPVVQFMGSVTEISDEYREDLARAVRDARDMIWSNMTETHNALRDAWRGRGEFPIAFYD